MNTTAHPVAPEEVMAFLDGELCATDAQAISTHLEHCAECTAIAEQFRTTSEKLTSWTVDVLPPSLEETILKDSKGEKRSSSKALRKLIFQLPFSLPERWGLATIACAILIAAGISSGLFLGTTRFDKFAPFSEVKMTSNAAPMGTLGKLPEAGKMVAGGGGGGDRIASPSLHRPMMKGTDTGSEESEDPQSKQSFQQPMIARTVALSIVTKDFVASRASLDTILARRHGYAAQLTVSTAENAARSLQASLRIRAPELSSAIADLKTLGRVESESQNGEEVTQQHADLVARLKNSRETEQRLQAILAQRTGKISDVLEVEQEIARVRGEIEEMEAEQKNLEHRVDFATVNLQLTEEYKAELNAPAASVSTRVHNAFVAGYRNASETMLGFVLFFAESGPTLLIWLLIFLVPGWMLWRRYRRSLAAIA